MFKFTSNCILGALIIFAYASTVTSAPSKRDALHTPITICSETEFGHCLAFEIADDQCLNLTGAGGLDAYDKNISSAKIEDPNVLCTFYRYFDCNTDSTSNNKIILGGGNYPDFSSVPGDHGLVDFDNTASSIKCIPNH